MIRSSIFLLFCLGLTGLHAQSRLAQHEFEAENIEEIKLNASFCDVRISYDSKVRFFGLIEGQGNPNSFNIYSELSNNGVIEIFVKQRGIKEVPLTRAYIELAIPKNIFLEIKSTSGDISGNDLATGRYNIETTSGDVRLSEIIGDLKVTTASGDIIIENLQGYGRFHTNSGDKKVSNVQGFIRSSTTSGSSSFNQIIGDMKLTATSGNIILKHVKGEIHVNTTSGNLSGQRIYITQDSQFELVTGDLDLELCNPDEDFSFDLYSGTGKLRVNGKDFEKVFLSGGGPIYLHSSTASGNQDFHF